MREAAASQLIRVTSVLSEMPPSRATRSKSTAPSAPTWLVVDRDLTEKERSTSGGLGMLGGGPICILSQRQQLASPDSHTSEVVSAGVNLSTVIPINGTLQELRIRCGAATPFYLDSKTTVFVATNDTAVKKSIWLVRRVAVIADGVKQGEIQPIHINDPDMCADPLTKYLTFPVWDRHMAYMLNRLP